MLISMSSRNEVVLPDLGSWRWNAVAEPIIRMEPSSRWLVVSEMELRVEFPLVGLPRREDTAERLPSEAARPLVRKLLAAVRSLSVEGIILTVDMGLAVAVWCMDLDSMYCSFCDALAA